MITMSQSMQQIAIEKVTVNIGVGEVSEEVDKACKLLKQLTGKEAVKTQAGKSSKSFGLREGLEIGAKVTLRGEEAVDFLQRAFAAIERLPKSSFDSQGNFSFGVEEYLNLPGIKYDPEIGIMGFDVAVTLERPGANIKREESSRKVGDSHKTKKEDSIEFIKSKFDVQVGEDGDNE